MKKEERKNVSKKIIKKAKGITLISLVITIIILLILAGVTLSLTLGDNGIITQAQKAKEAQEIAAIKEDFQLAILDKELEKGGTGLTKEELEEIAGNYGELQEDGNTIKTDEGYEIKIDEIYKPGGGTGGDAATDEELAALQEKIEELEQTVEELTNTKTELEGTIEDLNGQLEQAGEDKTALQEQIENLQGQVDSLNKTKEQLEATISDLNTQIADLKAKQSTGNATVAQVLQGATFSNSTSVGLTGEMPNRGAINQTLNAGGSYTIPAGYHNGSGKITVNSLASQTAANAGAGQILSGYTAWVNGNKITGNMTNRGALNWNPSGSSTYTVPAGYYSGGTLNSSGAYNAGVSAADNRVNTNSASYKNGYNAGYSAGNANFPWRTFTVRAYGEGTGTKRNPDVWTFTAPANGIYLIVGASSGTGDKVERYANITVNGTVYLSNHINSVNGSATQDLATRHHHHTVIAYMNKGATATINVYSNYNAATSYYVLQIS